MARVAVHNVDVLNNPCEYLNPLQFEITFDCMEKLEDDLEWKITYVGCPENQAYDQTLDSVLVGPVIPGRHKFVFQADAPDPKKIPAQDAVGVTVVLITCFYKNQEFVRIGYFVNNDYSDNELIENPPVTPDFTKIQRNILSSQPRVTKFHIKWAEEATPPPSSSTSGENCSSSLQQHNGHPTTGSDDGDGFPKKELGEGEGELSKLVNAENQKKLGERMMTAEVGDSSNSCTSVRVETKSSQQPPVNGHTALGGDGAAPVAETNGVSSAPQPQLNINMET